MQNRYKEQIFYDEGSTTLDQVVQKHVKCPIPGNIHSRAGQGSHQPHLVENVPAHCKRALVSPFQPKLLYDFVCLKLYHMKLCIK